MRELCLKYFFPFAAILLISGISGSLNRASASNRLTGVASPRLVTLLDDPTNLGDLLDSHGWQEMAIRGQLVREALPNKNSKFHCVYQQFLGGYPVIGGRLAITLDNQGRAILAHSSLAKWREELAPNFEITKDRAVEVLRGKAPIRDLDFEPQVDQVVLPVDGMPVYCYRLKVTSTNPPAASEYYINGSDGSLILVEDRLKYFDGRGLIFDPDPKSSLETDTLVDADNDSAAIPREAYTEVTLPDITFDEDSLLVLTGPWADTSPTEDRCRSDSGDFLFGRQDNRFEEVMAYYHIDRQARYLDQLGFGEFLPTPQILDIDRIEDDASFYNPNTGVITTGTGGVDDAEDADVLLHEYTHAILEKIIPEWRGGETAFITEGLCDYFAGDYSLSIAPDFGTMNVYNWDGHNEFWDGRILDSDYHYPEDCQGDAHDAGQIWSSLLTELRLTGERDLWNQIVLDHLVSLADSATAPYAAEALLTSDLNIADGRFRADIISACESRGIFTPGQFAPQFAHTPPRDTEDEENPIPISVFVESARPLDTTGVILIYNFGDEDSDTLRLTESEAIGGVYEGLIPPPHHETDVSYYFTATDETGIFNSDPPNSPEEKYHFLIGPDRFAPVIFELDSLPDSVFPDGAALFGASVRDNLAVADARLNLYNSHFELISETQLISADDKDGYFYGRIHWNVQRDETVFYRLRVSDAAARPNVTNSRLRHFTIRSEAIIDDFEIPTRVWQSMGWMRTDNESYSGEWCIIDRSPEAIETPRETYLVIGEPWNFSGMVNARLKFQERHIFDRSVMEHGSVELNVEGEWQWRELLSVAGIQGNWVEREIDLDRWAMRNSPDIRLRFHSISPEGAEQFPGWLIDDIRLQVGNIVSANGDSESLIPVTFLSDPYPNPTNGFLSFRVSLPQPGVVSLVDVAGRSVISLPIATGNRSYSLSLDELPSGSYWLTIPDGAISSQRIILLK